MIITDLEITAKQAEAQGAEDEWMTAKRQAMTRGAAEVAEHTMSRLVKLELRAASARALAEDLAVRQEQQRAELAARDARERAASAALAEDVARLESSRADLLGAAAVAEAALLALADAAAAHDVLVADVRSRLLGHGLRLSDVDPAAGHETGGDERVGLRLRGRFWAAVDPTVLVLRTVARVARAAWGPHSLPAVRLALSPGVSEFDQRSAGLLDELPDLPRHAPTARVRPRVAWDPWPKSEPGPWLSRAETARLLNPRPLPGWEDSA